MTESPPASPPAQPQDGAESTPVRGSVEDLLSILDLQEVGSAQINVDSAHGSEELSASEATVFLGQSQKMPHGRVFGGQVLAQCVIAAGRTVDIAEGQPARPIHSLHAYFMRPGDDTMPIRFAVERMMDGNSFTTRRVHALQHGRPILAMSASFQVRSGGLDHQTDAPDVAGPEGIPSLGDVFGGIDDPRAVHLAQRPIEQRHVEGNMVRLDPAAPREARQHVWMRAVGALPDDPLVHAAVMAYASDYSLLESALRRHGVQYANPALRIASLDHAMWFHRPARLDDWCLYVQESPSSQSGRALGIGRIYQGDTLVATVAQEGMVRLKEQ